MLWRVVFFGVIVPGAHAFAPLPIEWRSSGTRKFMVVAGGFPNEVSAAPLKLMIKDVSNGVFSNALPVFTVKPDKTIRWHDWCIEVGGTKKGDDVRLNRCTGGSNQKFTWLLWGRGRKNKIQLEGSTKCLDIVDKEGDLNRAPIVLQECEDQSEGSWSFEGLLPLSNKIPSQMHGSFLSSIVVSFVALVGTLGLGAFLWQWQKHARNGTGQGSLSSGQGGVALISRSSAHDKPKSDTNAQQMVPAVMEHPSLALKTSTGEPLANVPLVPAVMALSSLDEVIEKLEHERIEHFEEHTVPSTQTVSVTSDVSEPRPLKVIIAGGGVGGLTAAFSMLKAGFDVTVYEKTAAFGRFGGPIQLATNALSTLKAIDETIFDRVMEKFTFTATRRCGIKDGLRADGFRMTSVLNPGYLFDESAPADWYVSFPLKECADTFGLPYSGVINRADLQDILLDECQKLKEDFIVNGNLVTKYTQTSDGVVVTLGDGTSVAADVLVGSDGIWSAVRAQMYNEGQVRAKSADGMTQQGCPYSGYTVFAGEFVPSNEKDFGDYFECGYKVYIGPGKYFVTCDVGNGRVQWYSFLAQPPGTARARDSWEGDASTDAEGANVISYLKSLHKGWTSEIHYVLDSTPATAVEQRDLYDRWPEFSRSWADGTVVLMGDAVHPMLPNLGQGGCMAIEDAYELTRALSAVTVRSLAPKDSKLVGGALQTFYKRRVLRVAGVSVLSRMASEVTTKFDAPWSPHDSVGESPLSTLLTFFAKPVLQYIIFPLQFLFLYSYHPSGEMGELPKMLEASWRKRHAVSAREAFARAATMGQPKVGPSFFAVTADEHKIVTATADEHKIVTATADEHKIVTATADEHKIVIATADEPKIATAPAEKPKIATASPVRALVTASVQ